MADDQPELRHGIGHAITVLRTERGMSRKDLAEAAGVSYTFLSEVETGRKRASTRTLAALAEALQIHVHELMAEGEARSGRDTSRRWFGDEEPTAAAVPEMAAAPAPEPHPRMRRQVPRSPTSVLRELSALIEDMHPDDVERLLDLARRLSER